MQHICPLIWLYQWQTGVSLVIQMSEHHTHDVSWWYSNTRQGRVARHLLQIGLSLSRQAAQAHIRTNRWDISCERPPDAQSNLPLFLSTMVHRPMTAQSAFLERWSGSLRRRASYGGRKPPLWYLDCQWEREVSQSPWMRWEWRRRLHRSAGWVGESRDA